MNTDYLVNSIKLQNYWRATLPLRSLYIIVFNNLIIFISFQNIYFTKHLHLWISFLLKLFFSRIPTNSKLKLHLFIFVLLFSFIQLIESALLEIRNKIVLVVFSFLFILVVLYKLLQTILLLFVKFN